MSEQEKIKKLNIAVAVLNFVFAAMLLCGAVYFTYVAIDCYINFNPDAESDGSMASLIGAFLMLFAKSLRWLIIFVTGSCAVTSLIDCAFKIIAGVMFLKHPDGTACTGDGYRLLRSFGFTFDGLFIILVFLICFSNALLYIPFALLLALLITKAILNKKLLKLIQDTHLPREPFDL